MGSTAGAQGGIGYGVPMTSSSPSSASHPYEALTPDLVVDALDHVGLAGDGRLMSLNSFENRVYLAHLEDGLAPDPLAGALDAVVLKFYRPGRWSTAQILEEHAFAAELMAADVPVVGPLRLQDQPDLAHLGDQECLSSPHTRHRDQKERRWYPNPHNWCPL